MPLCCCDTHAHVLGISERVYRSPTGTCMFRGQAYSYASINGHEHLVPCTYVAPWLNGTHTCLGGAPTCARLGRRAPCARSRAPHGSCVCARVCLAHPPGRGARLKTPDTTCGACVLFLVENVTAGRLPKGPKSHPKSLFSLLEAFLSKAFERPLTNNYFKGLPF